MNHTRLFWRSLLTDLVPVLFVLVLLVWFVLSLDVKPIHIFAAIVLSAIAIGLSVWLALKATKTLARAVTFLDQVALDEPDDSVTATQVDSLESLSDAIGEVARKSRERSGKLNEQRAEQDTVISAMLEGVMVVDADEKVASINPAAVKLLGLGTTEPVGRTLQETIRSSELQRLVSRTLRQGLAAEADITVSGTEDRYLQVTSTVLQSGSGGSARALVVLNDVTRLHKLEQVRRDFVANVSHELKTPITSIKGYVETLLDGAFRDPADAERFLSIIARQSNRLNAIIEDLLELARIEQGVEKGEILLEKACLKGLLSAAVVVCESHAEAKSTKIAVSCADELMARVNPPLLEQAIVNLIDNAIKYNPAGSAIEVSARQEVASIVIEIRDNGVGIGPDHLPRLFERFYRVDKSRSRSEGGTGLGLAITKHIVLAHGGKISVSSQVGAGSTFAICIPC